MNYNLCEICGGQLIHENDEYVCEECGFCGYDNEYLRLFDKNNVRINYTMCDFVSNPHSFEEADDTTGENTDNTTDFPNEGLMPKVGAPNTIRDKNTTTMYDLSSGTVVDGNLITWTDPKNKWHQRYFDLAAFKAERGSTNRPWSDTDREFAKEISKSDVEIDKSNIRRLYQLISRENNAYKKSQDNQKYWKEISVKEQKHHRMLSYMFSCYYAVKAANYNGFKPEKRQKGGRPPGEALSILQYCNALNFKKTIGDPNLDSCIGKAIDFKFSKDSITYKLTQEIIEIVKNRKYKKPVTDNRAEIYIVKGREEKNTHVIVSPNRAG